MRGEPPRALLHDVAHPVERLDVLLEGGAAEQADLCDVRRAVPGEPALALDRFDHRGFFAADIRAGAAEAAQRGVADRLDNLITGARAGKAGLEQRIAALANVALEILRRGIGSRVCALSDRCGDTFLARPHHLHVADGADRRAVAS